MENKNITVKGNLYGHISWNGWFYAYKKVKTRNGSKQKYYKSKNARFDSTCGGTYECSLDEYNNAAKNYAEIMNKR